ncbi:hypothetical protein TD95_000758 [Thielaviopsis punctulata]|uniref:aspartyl aminopeptidase n=1 Tax=Thielaviopsis punctulata TaxID=72032 RepID=A0A0F4Z8D9_9PEZI|nr:hypothetical protein TD95_000758 [Thielaviopsis punctulata]
MASATAFSASAQDFVDFVNSSPTPYHAVQSIATRLENAGFQKLREREPWAAKIHPGGKYFLTRNASSIIAFAVGGKWSPGNPVAMVGAHTDSPCLRIKPVSKKQNVGFMQVGVETYGGGIWHSWFDRDLSIAGRVLVRDGEGNFVQRLIKVNKPILRIPTLAIHLDRSTNFDPNKETQLFPIVGLASEELNRTSDDAKTDSSVMTDDVADAQTDGFQPLAEMSTRHHPHVLDVIAEHAGCEVADIVDFELVLYDVQPSAIGGINDEFVFSPRLDNLEMTYCTVSGIINSVADNDALLKDSSIRLATCFDHEEIGSLSAQGANSNFLPSVLRRLVASDIATASPGSVDSMTREPDESAAFEQTLARSFLVSADMAHSVHPNYAGKYESDHRPAMNKGTVIKINANQRYATNSPGVVLLQECARRAGVPLQLFVVRNDSSCGSTIGPMLSAKMGVRTLDLGNPQLSMHSIRETGGSKDILYAIKLFEQFYASYSDLESKILVD